MDTNENPATPTTAETVPEAAAPQTEPTPPMPTEAAPTAPQTAPVPPKKKGVPVVLIIILCVLVVFVVFIALVMGGGMALYEGFGGDTQAKAKQYLENKYGSDQGFSEGVLSGGSMFETGSVEYEFSSIKGGKNFYVAYSNDRGFSDNYYWVLYKKEFKDYYYNKYGKELKSAIPYKFTVYEGDYQYGESELFPLIGENVKYDSFKELVELVQEKRHDSNLVVSLNVDYTEIGNEKLDTLNASKLHRDVFDILYRKDLNAGADSDTKITYNLNIMMEGSGRTGLCPENLDAETLRPSSSNVDDPDEEIWICQVKLYESR